MPAITTPAIADPILYTVVYGEEGEGYGQDLAHARVKCFSGLVDAICFVHSDWAQSCRGWNHLHKCPPRPDLCASFWAWTTPECHSIRVWTVSECRPESANSVEKGSTR